MSHANGHPAWYREPLVWMVIAFPAAAVIAGIITIILAIRSEDGLVVDDYYKQGLEINRTLDRDRTAREHKLGATIHYPGAGDTLMVVMSSDDNYTLPEQLTVSLLHATRKGYDQVFSISRSGENRYVVPVSRLNPGDWHILIETEEWRVLEQIRVR